MSDSFSWRCSDCGAVAVTRDGMTWRLFNAAVSAGEGRFRVLCPADESHAGVVLEEGRVAGGEIYVGDNDA